MEFDAIKTVIIIYNILSYMHACTVMHKTKTTHTNNYNNNTLYIKISVLIV